MCACTFVYTCTERDQLVPEDGHIVWDFLEIEAMLVHREGHPRVTVSWHTLVRHRTRPWADCWLNVLVPVPVLQVGEGE